MSWNIFQEGVVPLPSEGHVLIHINMIAKSFQDTSRDCPSCNSVISLIQWISPYFCTIFLCHTLSSLSAAFAPLPCAGYWHISLQTHIDSFPHLVASFNFSQIPKTANKLQFFHEQFTDSI
jgi:hypothetical protein